ncbi:hypothetical protein BJX68DRAFT_230044 [Aspergillus pseudodeflectus]|uniref:Uncharacterized protein n=1 Tax=Aspergillus pseudodeflectus TaxID=176178 RepID=A0ABR4KV50_9EURO
MPLTEPSRTGMARLFAFVEDWLDKRSAQLFRKFQHKVFGLTDQEWDAFHTLLGSHEAMGIAVQRNRWFATNTAYFNDLERNGTSDEARDLAREAWQMYYFELKENRAVCEQIKQAIRAAEERVRHTPIYRAFYCRRQNKFWFHDYLLLMRCIQSGGCCARVDCQCCLEDRDPRFGVWQGHCTPACLCCTQYYNINEPIANLESPITLPYSLRPRAEDTVSHQMMDVMVWNP